ncbi:MAG: zincin-like metallopeptidase domain-containing protein [Bryobacteraceae bacterium]
MPNSRMATARRINLPQRSCGIIRVSALWALCRSRHKTHWSGHPARLNRATLTDSYTFGDPNYAKEELRAELASVFLAAERSIPHNPEQHAAYVASWIAALREDKNEIFRAAKDAHHAADFLLALEQDKSVDKALRRETSEHVAAFEPGSATVNTTEKDSATEHRTPATRTKPPDRNAAAGIETEKILHGEVAGLIEARALTTEVLGDQARLYAAHTDSGRYTGEIIGATAGHIVQKLSPQSAVAHPKDLLPGTLETGRSLVVSYSNNQAFLRAADPRTKSKELAR